MVLEKKTMNGNYPAEVIANENVVATKIIIT